MWNAGYFRHLVDEREWRVGCPPGKHGLLVVAGGRFEKERRVFPSSVRLPYK
jgi:hypothetical protein